MELRWILVLAGVGILAFLYFSGRPRKARPVNRGAQAPLQNAENPGNLPVDGGYHDGGYQDHQGYSSNQVPNDGANPAGGQQGYNNGSNQAGAGGMHVPPGHPGLQHDHRHPPPVSQAQGGPESAPMHTTQGHYQGEALAGSNTDPLMNDSYSEAGVQDSGYIAPQNAGHAHAEATAEYAHSRGSVQDAPGMGFDIDPGDMQRPADMVGQVQHAAPPAQAGYAEPPTGNPHAGYPDGVKPASGFSSLLSTLSGGILGKDRSGGASGYAEAGGLHPEQGTESMIITLHVVAPDGQVIHGPRLQALFEQRGYHYGEMNIFHSLNQGSIVFSVAKMLEPGTFDINNPGSFETPGISLILQLPAPVASDVAFDVLISEATEMANALGCNILDAGHSTLSRQTIQHLRDSVHQFMHRQRLAETVPS